MSGSWVNDAIQALIRGVGRKYGVSGASQTLAADTGSGGLEEGPKSHVMELVACGYERAKVARVFEYRSAL